MQEYDYRIAQEAVDEAETEFERLSSRQRVKLYKVAEELQQTQKKERMEKAKDYFNKAILPGLKDFAETSDAFLCIQERDEQETVQALFKSKMGFDIRESCRLTRNLLLMANFIGIMTEEENTILSLVYDYKELLDR